MILKPTSRLALLTFVTTLSCGTLAVTAYLAPSEILDLENTEEIEVQEQETEVTSTEVESNMEEEAPEEIDSDTEEVLFDEFEEEEFNEEEADTPEAATPFAATEVPDPEIVEEPTSAPARVFYRNGEPVTVSSPAPTPDPEPEPMNEPFDEFSTGTGDTTDPFAESGTLVEADSLSGALVEEASSSGFVIETMSGTLLPEEEIDDLVDAEETTEPGDEEGADDTEGTHAAAPSEPSSPSMDKMMLMGGAAGLIVILLVVIALLMRGRRSRRTMKEAYKVAQELGDTMQHAKMEPKKESHRLEEAISTMELEGGEEEDPKDKHNLGEYKKEDQQQ